jgi:dCTP deaminase
MTLLVDSQITELCRFPDTAMISPFSPISRSDATPSLQGPSWGLSSAGYDIRLGNRWKLPAPDFLQVPHQTSRLSSAAREKNTALDPNSEDTYYTVSAEQWLLQPGGFVLAVTPERFKMPNNVLGLCTGKSTLARFGILVFVTPLEPSWEGYLTLEIVNLGKRPVNLQSGIGICQLNFFRTDEVPHKSYLARNGKYMLQGSEPVAARITD